MSKEHSLLSSSSITTPTLTTSPMPSDDDEAIVWKHRQNIFITRQLARRKERLQRRSALVAPVPLETNEKACGKYASPGAMTSDTTGLKAAEPKISNKKKEKSFSNETGLAMVLLLMLLSFGGLGLMILYDTIGSGREQLGMGDFARFASP